MLLTPQPDSSSPASTVISGMQVRRRMYTEWLMLYLPDDSLTARYRYLTMIGLVTSYRSNAEAVGSEKGLCLRIPVTNGSLGYTSNPPHKAQREARRKSRTAVRSAGQRHR